jgi:hypothetical protein
VGGDKGGYVVSNRPASSDRDRLNAIALRDIEYHSIQFNNPYRSTVHLAEFIQSLAGRHGGQALDVGCGDGVNI